MQASEASWTPRDLVPSRPFSVNTVTCYVFFSFFLFVIICVFFIQFFFFGVGGFGVFFFFVFVFLSKCYVFHS